jgi:hypothetical protein
MSIKYHPLENRSKDIRLLELLPTEDGAQSQLQARLIHSALESASYTAISYVW